MLDCSLLLQSGGATPLTDPGRPHACNEIALALDVLVVTSAAWPPQETNALLLHCFDVFKKVAGTCK